MIKNSLSGSFIVSSLLIHVALYAPALAQVREDWSIVYDGPSHGRDEPEALVLDSQGNVYVTGSSYKGTGSDYRTVKYSRDGQVLWEAFYDEPSGEGNTNGTANPMALVVDRDGNTFVTGGSVTAKYDAEGHERWIARYDDGCASSLAVDSEGNVYVTGYSGVEGGGLDATTVKYDPEGSECWVARYDGPNSLADFGDAIVVDKEKNTYVSGLSYGETLENFTTTEEYVTVKYDSEGNELWTARTGGCEWVTPWLTIDSEGNIYVAGWRHTRPGDGSAFPATVKYSPSGRELWVKESVAVVAANDLGQVYGYKGATPPAWEVAKFDKGGNEIWATRTGGVFGPTYGSGLAVDREGNVYAMGTLLAETTGMDYVVAKYSSEGELWIAQFDGPHSLNDRPKALGIDDQGNVFVTGKSHVPGSSENWDWATVKYEQVPLERPFLRGNANADDNTDLSDAVFVLNYLFLGGTEPTCEDAADTDDNGVLDITDGIYLLNYLFLGGFQPPTPFLECGLDPTIEDPAELTCGEFPPCAGPR